MQVSNTLPKSWVERWLKNGANLITLSRIPMTAGILFLVWAILYGGFTSIWWFFTLVIAQAIGMITDGLDGWYARRFEGGGTPEGQFLDQFIDKIFVWTIWIVATLLFAFKQNLPLFTDWSLGVWILSSLWLLRRDIQSCRGHWKKYLDNRDRPFNKKLGAINWGKRKFFFENIAMCIALLLLSPKHEAMFIPLRPFFWWLHQWQIELAFTSLLIAIVCAEISVRKRGVIKKKSTLEAIPPKQFAEAVTDLGDSGE